MKTFLCNSNKFIKSQQIVKSMENGHTMVAIRIETKIALHWSEVEPGLKTS